MGSKRKSEILNRAIIWTMAALALDPCRVVAQDDLPVATPIDADRQRAVACLTVAIAYEAGFEPVEGQQAVAEVVLNRMRSPAYPKSVCGVVFAGSERRTGCQFTFTCDGAMARRLPDAVIARARSIAEAALDGRNPLRALGATHYHANYVSPYWAPSLIGVSSIGRHIFYRSPGALDQSAEPRPIARFAEPVIGRMRGFDVAFNVPDTHGAPPATNAGRAHQPSVFAPWGLAIAR